MELVLPARAASARAARGWVLARLSELGLEQLCEAVELLVSEVVTNAVIHQSSQLRLRLRPDGAGVRVEVLDGSRVLPVHRHYSSTATTGRGLTLLDTVADEWGWDVGTAGKSVWFRVGVVA